MMIDQEIREHLHTISSLTRKQFAKAFRQIGLHRGQEHVLYHLWIEDVLTQTQLRERIVTEASTISNMLKKLADDGIIERKRGETDSRVINVFLTEKGRNLKEPVYQIWREHRDILLDGLIVEEKLILRRILQQLSENLEQNES